MAVSGGLMCNEPVDQEWIYLMMTAREMGINPEEIRTFLSQASQLATDRSSDITDHKCTFQNP